MEHQFDLCSCTFWEFFFLSNRVRLAKCLSLKKLHHQRNIDTEMETTYLHFLYLSKLPGGNYHFLLFLSCLAFFLQGWLFSNFMLFSFYAILEKSPSSSPWYMNCSMLSNFIVIPPITMKCYVTSFGSLSSSFWLKVLYIF